MTLGAESAGLWMVLIVAWDLILGELVRGFLALCSKHWEGIDDFDPISEI